MPTSKYPICWNFLIDFPTSSSRAECTIMHHWDCYSGKKLLPKSRQNYGTRSWRCCCCCSTWTFLTWKQQFYQLRQVGSDARVGRAGAGDFFQRRTWHPLLQGSHFVHLCTRPGKQSWCPNSCTVRHSMGVNGHANFYLLLKWRLNKTKVNSIGDSD